MPKLALNGFSMYYETFGSGQPLLFLPGALGSGNTDFEHQLAWFSQSYQVVAPDPRGYGQSRPPVRDYPWGFYQRDAEDVLALMTVLGHQEFTVFGWSDGANIGVLMAANAAERIRSLVVWGGNSYLSAEEITAFQAVRVDILMVAKRRGRDAAGLRRFPRSLVGKLCRGVGRTLRGGWGNLPLSTATSTVPDPGTARGKGPARARIPSENHL